MMWRLIGLFVGVVLAKSAVTLVIAWLAHRPTASWSHVGCVATTVILGCVVLVVQEFADHGLTLYGVVFALLMIWLSSGAAARGTAAFQVMQRHQQEKT